MTIIPKSTLTFRIADTPENVRALLAQNTADHVMTGPPPNTLFRGRIEGDRIQIYNALPTPRSRLAPIRIQLDEQYNSTVLTAELGPSKQMKFLIWLPIVMLPVATLKIVEPTFGGVWIDSAGISTYLWLLAFVGAVWGAAVEFKRYRQSLGSEQEALKAKLKRIFGGIITGAPSG